MSIGSPDDENRFLTYALNLGCAVSVLHDYAVTGVLPQAGCHKLEFVRDHLARFAKAEELLAAPPGPIVPDLESVQIYGAVLRALEMTEAEFEHSGPGAVVTGLISVLSQVLNGASPNSVIEQLRTLERVLEALASIYAGRAGALG